MHWIYCYVVSIYLILVQCKKIKHAKSTINCAVYPFLCINKDFIVVFSPQIYGCVDSS